MNFIVNNRLILVFAGIVSIMLTMWAITVDPIINPDAIIYLSVADEIAQGNFSNALSLYKWPFYSGFIAFLHSITGLSTLNSAYTLNTIFHVLAVVGFLACVHALGANKRTLLIAAILILLFPSMNKYRAFIIRDAGFIAFYLWMAYHLIQGINKQQLTHFIWAALFIILATLFRIEGIVPLLILPAYLQYLRSKGVKQFLWLLIIIVSVIGVLIGMSIWLFGQHANRLEPGVWGFISASTNYAMQNLDHRIIVIKTYVLNSLSEQFAPAVLLSSVLIVTLYEPLRRLSFIFAYFSWHAIKSKLVLQKGSLKKVFYVLCLIQLSLLALFMAINMFLVSRHTLALSLTVLLLAPFSINYFYDKWFNFKEKKYQWRGIFISFLLAIIAIDGLDVKTNQNGVKEQGQWVEANIDSKYSVYSNNKLLLYYADKNPAYLNLSYDWGEAERLLDSKEIFDFDYAVFEIEKDNKQAEEYIQNTIGTPLFLDHTFPNGKRLLAYDIRYITSNRSLHPKYFKLKNKPIF